MEPHIPLPEEFLNEKAPVMESVFKCIMVAAFAPALHEEAASEQSWNPPETYLPPAKAQDTDTVSWRIPAALRPEFQKFRLSVRTKAFPTSGIACS